ncbi:hypothetical protein D9M72_473860 [compost metagenome]
MQLDPCAISEKSTPRIDPSVSDGKMQPSPIRPSTASATSSRYGVEGDPSAISRNDSASSASPTDTWACGAIRCVKRPATAMVNASITPAGSSTRPAREGVYSSAICI